MRSYQSACDAACSTTLQSAVRYNGGVRSHRAVHEFSENNWWLDDRRSEAPRVKVTGLKDTYSDFIVNAIVARAMSRPRPSEMHARLVVLLR